MPRVAETEARPIVSTSNRLRMIMGVVSWARPDAFYASPRSQFAEPVSRSHSAIHQKVTAGDECTVRTHEECANSSHLVRSAGSAGRRNFDHVPVSWPARPSQFIIRERGDDNPGTDRVDTRASL